MTNNNYKNNLSFSETYHQYECGTRDLLKALSGSQATRDIGRLCFRVRPWKMFIFFLRFVLIFFLLEEFDFLNRVVFNQAICSKPASWYMENQESLNER